MFKKKLSVVVPVAMVGLTLAVLAPAHADGKKPVAKPVTAVKAPVTATQNGMVVVKDPVTGQLRGPTAEEAAALAAAAPPAQSSAQVGSGPTTFQGPAGSKGVKLDDSTTVFTVATKGADGTVKVGEVTGEVAAKQAGSQTQTNHGQGAANNEK